MTDKPTRLIEDGGLPEHLLRDLGHAASASPAQYDAEAGLARLKGAIAPAAVGTGGDLGVEGSANTVATSGTTKLLAIALAGAGIIAGVVVASAVVLSESPDVSAPPELLAPSNSPSPVVQPPTRVDPSVGLSNGEPVVPSEPTSAVVAARNEGDSVEAEEPKQPEVAAPPKRRGRVPSRRGARVAARKHRAKSEPSIRQGPEATATPSTDPDQLLRLEIAELARARQLLISNPQAAVRLVHGGQRKFVGGMFEEERTAIEVFALETLDAPKLEVRARAYLAKFPNGQFSARVREILEGSR